MIRFILRRLAQAVPTLLAVVTVSFFLMRLAPGGPFDLERPLAPAALENLRRVYGLDRPLIVQFGSYLASLARGDLGPSFSFRDQSVLDLIVRGLPVSATLGALALGLALQQAPQVLAEPDSGGAHRHVRKRTRYRMRHRYGYPHLKCRTGRYRIRHR